MNIKQIIEHAENEIAEGSRGRQYIIEDVVNAVLDLVEKEVVEYKKRIGMPSGFGENAVRADASRDTLDYISTIMNNLRV